MRRLSQIKIEATAGSAPSRGPQRTVSCLEHVANLRMLRQQLLRSFPLVADPAHPAHIMLKRAQAAEDDQCWELAFNELFAAEEISSKISTGSRINSTSSSTADSSRTVMKRTVSVMLGEETGEPRHVARRLLDEAAGDEGEAFERALLIKDLEHGRNNFNCQVELNSSEVECLICTEKAGTREAVRLQPCHHGWYCITCIQRNADAKIGEGATVGAIRCPECQQALSEALLRALLTKTQMERLHQQSVEAAVSSCKGLRPCPTPDCPNRVVLEDGVLPLLKCEVCHKEHCLLCSASPFHTGKTCEEHLRGLNDTEGELALKKWMMKVGAKQCPQCRAVVTKQNLKKQATQESECHKMICRVCRTRFCFGCLAVLTDVQTCGCTPDSHSFIDPETGDFVRHLAKARRR